MHAFRSGDREHVVDQEVADRLRVRLGLRRSRARPGSRFRRVALGLPPARPATASRSARVARTACQVLTAVPRTSAAATTAAVAIAARFRRANFRQPIPGRRRARLHRLVGQVPHHVGREVVGRLVPPPPVLLQRLHHDPVQLAPHRPVRAACGSACRLAETVVSVSPSVLSRVLGLGGSSSRMIRRISSNAACWSVSGSNGVVPVSSS